LAVVLPARASEAGVPALVVGTQRVSAEELAAGARLERLLTNFHQSPSAEALAAARRKVAARLADLLLLEALAERRGVEADPAQLEARWQAAARSYGGPQRFGALLARVGMSEAAYRRQLSWQVRGDALVARAVAAEGPIPEARLRAHFEQNRDRYTLPASLHVVAALVKLDPSRLSEPGYRKSLEARAAKVAARMRAGDGVDALRAAFPGVEVKDLGFAHAGALIEELAGAVSKLEVGGVAGPVRALRGYYAARLEEKRPSRPLPFEQVRDAIRAELEKARQEATRQRLLAEARRTLRVHGTDAPKLTGGQGAAR
jgi:parvulin-like peptidyl-prolyl isomerase